jgi:hypothetical protein
MRRTVYDDKRNGKYLRSRQVGKETLTHALAINTRIVFKARDRENFLGQKKIPVARLFHFKSSRFAQQH